MMLSMLMGALGLSVSPSTSGAGNSSDISTVHAGVRFNSTGTEDSISASGSFNVGSRGNWLQGGTAAEVWVQRVITSGALDTDAGSGRLQLSTSRTFAVQDSTIAGGAVTCLLTFNFYDASAGGNLIGSSGAITLSANRESV